MDLVAKSVGTDMKYRILKRCVGLVLKSEFWKPMFTSYQLQNFAMEQ